MHWYLHTVYSYVQLQLVAFCFFSLEEQRMIHLRESRWFYNMPLLLDASVLQKIITLKVLHRQFAHLYLIQDF